MSHLDGNDHGRRFDATVQEAYVQAVARGVPRVKAAREVGISYDSVRRWALAHPDYQARIDEARRGLWEVAEEGLLAALRREVFVSVEGREPPPGVQLVRLEEDGPWGYWTIVAEPWAVKLALERGLGGEWAPPAVQVAVSGQVEVTVGVQEVGDLRRSLEARREELASLDAITAGGPPPDAPPSPAASLDDEIVDAEIVDEEPRRPF